MSKKFLGKRQTQTVKKYLKKYTQLVKFIHKASNNALTRISIFLSQNRKVFYKTAIIGVCFVNLYANIDVASASEVYEQSILNPEKSIISQDISSYKKTTQSINPFIGNNLVTDNVIEDKITEKDMAYLEKPSITETESRLKIEEDKKAKEEEDRYLEYQRYLALNYTATDTNRDVIVRDESETRNLSQSFQNNTYYYGYCTWYVASRKNIPNQWGNAGSWFSNAQTSGYATGYEPAPGSIIVTAESGWGHVGYVENVGPDSITISEMNFAGWGIVNTREISKSNPVIMGYIY